HNNQLLVCAENFADYIATNQAHSHAFDRIFFNISFGTLFELLYAIYQFFIIYQMASVVKCFINTIVNILQDVFIHNIEQFWVKTYDRRMKALIIEAQGAPFIFLLLASCDMLHDKKINENS